MFYKLQKEFIKDVYELLGKLDLFGKDVIIIQNL